MFESLIGIMQAIHGFEIYGTFDSSIGDFVTGTISPFAPDFSSSNPMFAVNVCFIVLFLCPAARKNLKLKIIIFFGILSLLFSSVMHIISFFLISIFFGFLMCSKIEIRKHFKFSFVIIFFFAFLFVTQKGNLTLFESYANLFLEGKIPKVAVTRIALTELPDGQLTRYCFGVGPGQFVSRAGLIGTGMYLGTLSNPKKLPFLPTGISQYVKRYLLDLWEISEEDPGFGGSFLAKPWYSWLAVFTEYGILGVLFLLGMVGWILLEVRRSSHFQKMQWEGGCFAAGVFFFILIGTVENYWEITQAIFCGVLLLKIQFSRRNKFNEICQEST